MSVIYWEYQRPPRTEIRFVDSEKYTGANAR